MNTSILPNDGLFSLVTINEDEAKKFKELLGDDFAYLMDCYMKDIDEFIEQLAKETEVIYIS